MFTFSRWTLRLAVVAVIGIACVQLGPPPIPTPDPDLPVDATTLDRKVMFGYRGRYGCPGDGSRQGAWQGWFRGGAPVAAEVTVDLWPDTSELGDAELCATDLLLPGGGGGAALDAIRRDWAYLVDTLRITESSRYLRHDGKPVLGIRGLGSTAARATPEEAMALVEYLRTGAEPRFRVTLVGGVPVQWRTLTGDSQTDPAWAEVYRSFDVISPWAVGGYGDETGADFFKRRILIPDVEEAAASGIGYMAVVWPGLSRHNLTAASQLNSVPRNGGHFYWRQVHNAISAEADMLYVASFDGVGEGTAMFKLAPSAEQAPAEGVFVPLDADGFALPGDWYLRLGGETGKVLRGEIPLSPNMPVTPARLARDTSNRLRIEYKSTSDWTTLRIESQDAIIVMEIIGTQGEPTIVEADYEHLALGQSLYAAQSGRTIGITVKYTLDPEALENGIILLLQKGSPGRVVLRVIEFTNTGARVLHESNLTVTEGEGVDTPLPIILDRLLD